MRHDASELIRLKYKYRRMILRGELDLPLDAARQLVGPDCAYHLYFMVGNDNSKQDCGEKYNSPAGRQRKRR